MLCETVSDPRRANWLTISMSEDICWPEENGPNRPSWELEAEILRLTTRLMMRENELRQVRSELKSQSQNTEQKMISWKHEIADKEKQMQLLLVQKDSEMEAIVSQLLLFEAELRREQNRIEKLLQEKDTTIRKQQEEIQRLKSEVEVNATTLTEHNLPSSDYEESRDSTSSLDSGIAEPQNGNTIDEKELVLPKKPVLVCRTSSLRSNRNISSTVSASGSRLPGNSHSDAHVSTNPAVKKIRDSLMRIRAIQDLTNVQSKSMIPDLRTDSILSEKRRIPQKLPQKMKDLKAKRFNVQHRNHRTDFCGQVIL